MKPTTKDSLNASTPSTPGTPAAPIALNPLDQRLVDAARTILERFADGQLVIQGHEGPALPTVPVTPLRRPTPKELRSTLLTARTSPDVEKDVRTFLRDAREPKRQRKTRVMAARKVYRLKRVASKETLKALQSMTPAMTSVVMYLASHPDVTVPQLVDQLDLRRKTIENIVSQLRQHGIVESIDVKD